MKTLKLKEIEQMPVLPRLPLTLTTGQSDRFLMIGKEKNEQRSQVSTWFKLELVFTLSTHGFNSSVK